MLLVYEGTGVTEVIDELFAVFHGIFRDGGVDLYFLKAGGVQFEAGEFFAESRSSLADNLGR